MVDKSETKVELTAKVPILVAHRGYSGRYPENTLMAFQAAYQHGAKYMELDLQLTQDRVPVLHHDASLKRMAGVDIDVRDIKVKYFKSLNSSYSDRFGKEFDDNKFTTFRKYCKWLAQHEDVTTFVEIKQESIDYLGVPVVIDEVYRRISKAEVEGQCVIISFNHEVLEYTRKISSMRIGWVLPRWNEANHEILKEMRPDFMFTDKAFLPSNDEDIWRGAWQWAVYNLDDISSAIAMANRGFRFLETNQIGTLMANEALSNRSV